MNICKCGWNLKYKKDPRIYLCNLSSQNLNILTLMLLQPILWPAAFIQKIEIPLIIGKNNFSFRTLYVFSSYWCSFIGFDYVSKMAIPRCHFFSDRISTSDDMIILRYGPQRRHLWTYYLSVKSHFHTFYSCKVTEWWKGELNLPLWAQTTTSQRNNINYMSSKSCKIWL